MTGSRPKVLSQADVKVSNSPVRVGDSPLAAAASIAASMPPGSLETSKHEPQLSVETDDVGDVVRIRVHCGCGEEITICCDYPNVA